MYEKGGEAGAESSRQSRADGHRLLVPDSKLLKEVDGKEGNVVHASEGVEGEQGEEDEEGLPVLLAQEHHHQVSPGGLRVRYPRQLSQFLLQTSAEESKLQNT